MANRRNKRAQRQRRQPRAGNRQRNNNNVGDLSQVSGQERRFNFSTSPLSKSEWIGFQPTIIAALKRELNGVAEWKLVSVNARWQPLVSAVSDAGSVAIAPFPSKTLAAASGMGLDALLAVGGRLNQPSKTFPVPPLQIPLSQSTWTSAGVVDARAEAGYGIYASSKSKGDLGLLTGTMTIRVRGLSSSP